MDLAPNYRFVLQQITELCGPGAKVLDYGCGAGATVKAGREAGLDIVGCDIFYGGNDPAHQRAPGLIGTDVFEMPGGIIPFPDDSFDLVVANQVFEHVTDLDLALDEIRRVLKPNGALLNLFPSIGVVREGHCGVIGAHWLNRMPRLQVAWLWLGRVFGAGYHKEDKTAAQWARDFSHYLRNFTVYRSMRTIRRAHQKRFRSIEWREPEYIGFRLALRGQKVAARLARGLLAPLARIASRSMASMVMVARS
jgi:ubiquinone/menaquinone biosynthesis C-methylase UbiE